jgi:membrane-associated phospholipid phosphatase
LPSYKTKDANSATKEVMDAHSQSSRRSLLLLGAIAVLYTAAVALSALTALVTKYASLDIAANGFFGPYRQRPLIDIFLWITTLGAGPTLLIVVLVASALLATAGRGALVRPLWLVYLGTEATVWATKYAVGRVRPDFISAASASSPSFPSGHSAGSLAIYGFLAYAIALRLADARHRTGIFLLTATVVFAIGFSRIFLSLHFVTDVIAGYAIGSFWLLAGILYCRRTASG